MAGLRRYCPAQLARPRSAPPRARISDSARRRPNAVKLHVHPSGAFCAYTSYHASLAGVTYFISFVIGMLYHRRSRVLPRSRSRFVPRRGKNVKNRT